MLRLRPNLNVHKTILVCLVQQQPFTFFRLLTTLTSGYIFCMHEMPLLSPGKSKRLIYLDNMLSN